jgi:hypothetical protein
VVLASTENCLGTNHYHTPCLRLRHHYNHQSMAPFGHYNTRYSIKHILCAVARCRILARLFPSRCDIPPGLCAAHDVGATSGERSRGLLLRRNIFCLHIDSSGGKLPATRLWCGYTGMRWRSIGHGRIDRASATGVEVMSTLDLEHHMEA